MPAVTEHRLLRWASPCLGGACGRRGRGPRYVVESGALSVEGCEKADDRLGWAGDNRNEASRGARTKKRSCGSCGTRAWSLRPSRARSTGRSEAATTGSTSFETRATGDPTTFEVGGGRHFAGPWRSTFWGAIVFGLLLGDRRGRSVGDGGLGSVAWLPSRSGSPDNMSNMMHGGC